MKQTLLNFSVFLLLITYNDVVFAQKHLENIPYYEAKQKDSLFDFDFNCIWFGNVAKKLWDKKSNMTFDKVVYTLKNGNKVYAKMEVDKKGHYAFKSPAYYLDTQQVFLNQSTKAKDWLDNFIAYHPNGKLWFEKISFEEGSKEVLYNPNGEILYRYTSFYNWGNEYEHDKMTISDTNMFISADPNMYRVSDDFTYYGLSYAGELHKDTGEKITGFFLPMDRYFGATTIVYVQGLNNQKGYWALYSNGKLETVFDDLNLPAPDMNAVLAAHAYEAYYIKKLKSNHYKHLFPNTKTPNELYTQIPVIQYGPKDPNYSGYGMRIHTANGDFPGSDRLIEVGIFKNGQLDGAGFKIELKLKANYNSRHVQLDISDMADINGTVGKFKNGVLSKGRSYTSKNANIKYHDYFSKPIMPHINYKGLGAGKLGYDVVDYKDWFSLLAVKKQFIYLQELGREFQVTRIDKQNKRIYFMSDEPNVEISVGPEQKGLYCKIFNSSSYSVYCKPYVYVNEYKTEPIQYDNYIPSMVVDSRKVSTANGYKVYTTIAKDVRVTTYLGTRQVKTGNTIKKICHKCQGTGKITYPNTKPAYALIDFDR